MSFVTTVILSFSKSENEKDRIREVNLISYKGQPINLCSVDDAPGDRNLMWYGGNRRVISNVYIGSYNHLDVKSFLRYLGTVNWDDPDMVQVFIQSEDEWNFNVYGNTGKESLVKATDIQQQKNESVYFEYLDRLNKKIVDSELLPETKKEAVDFLIRIRNYKNVVNKV